MACSYADPALVVRRAAASLLPPEDISGSEWAGAYRVLSEEDSGAAGRWDLLARPFQNDIMDCACDLIHEFTTVVGPSQWGKALALDTPLPTPTGWTTMGEVSLGDSVMGPRGEVVTVIGKSPVFHDRECFTVRFDDGSEILADAEHLWHTEATHGGPGVRSTREILQTLTKWGRSNHAIPVTAPLDLPTADLPIPPYVLGAWLGDGTSADARFTFGDQDREILDFIAAEGISVVINTDPLTGKGGDATLGGRKRGRLTCLRGHVKRPGVGACSVCSLQGYHLKKHGTPMDPVVLPSFHLALKGLGVLGNKHIPQSYLRGSKAQRLALLQGLMDTDGYIESGGKRCEFSVISEPLARGVFELVVSLGFKCRFATGRATLQGKDCGPRFRVTFQAYADTPVFRLPRKAERQRPETTSRPGITRRRFIVSVDPAPTVPVQCIAVDSEDHLYLAGRSMIPTHNTAVGLNIIGQTIHINPGPMMVVHPTISAAQKWSKTRFAPMVRDCQVLADLMAPEVSRDSSNTILEKGFPGGLLINVGANAPAGLASQPIKYLVFEELDRVPIDATAGDEGDYEALAIARTTDENYRRSRKIYRSSSPTLLGASRIVRAFEQSDQRYWFVTCPHCGHEQKLAWEGVHYEDEHPLDAYYQCQGRGCQITEPELRRAVRGGRWIATRPEVQGHAGFWIHGLMVRPMAYVVSEFLQARKGGSITLQTWKNTVLGEVWNTREGEEAKVTGLLKRARAAKYRSGEVPSGVGILTAGVDIQTSNPQRLEVVIRGTGVGYEQWTVQHVVIPGNLALSEPWDKLEALLGQEFPRQDGQKMKIRAVGIDTGGHFRSEALKFRKRPGLQGLVYPVKGASRFQRAVVIRAKTKYALWMVDTVQVKDHLFGNLTVETPGPRYQHFPSDLDQVYFDQLLGERPIHTAGRRGYEPYPKGQAVEVLDCHVYADAALHISGPWNLEELVSHFEKTAETKRTRAKAKAKDKAAPEAQSETPEEQPATPEEQLAPPTTARERYLQKVKAGRTGGGGYIPPVWDPSIRI